ncbi:MAG TPA: S1 family peptidase [Jiangellaceae bacterium]
MKHFPRSLVACAAVALVVAAGPPAAASGDEPQRHTEPIPETASPEMTAAMERDLGLTPAEIDELLEEEFVASSVAEKLEKGLGSAYAGSWIDDDRNLVVAITDRSHAREIRMLGARPKLVAHSEDQLTGAVRALDRAKRPSANDVAGWYVDSETNSVVVEALPGARGAAERFIRSSGVDASAVRVVTTTEKPRLYYDVRGGDAYYPGNSRCSIGFSVNGGFVTAGHCGGVGTTTSGYNQVSQGVVQGSSFPGNDYGWVDVNSNWTPTALVNRYSGSQTVTVAGSQEAAIGSSVCRSGSTTGWHCGEITAKNQTVNYAQGAVYGLTRTTACAEPGDSGGSWLTGQQAQGVTSGGSGNCTTGGVTYFQPVQEILSAYGLTLVTGDGGGGDPPPPPDGCDDYEYTFDGYLSGTGDYEIEPNGSYFYWGTSGTHQGCLEGPSGTDFDLYLQRWGGSGWQTVATSLSPDSSEELSYNGSAGYYRYIAYSYSGSGSYDLGINVP